MSERQVVTFQDEAGAQSSIAYRRQGAGSPVVMIHGVGLQGSVWAPQVRALAARYDVITPDMPGHGGSGLPPQGAKLADYAHAIVALLDGLGLAKAALVGHSMGSLVSLEVALSHPDRVTGVVAMNGVFCRTPEQSAAIAARLDSLDAPSPDWSGTLARWFGSPTPGHLQEASASTEALLADIQPVGYARTYRLFATADAAHRDRLTSLAVPALFLTGEGDPNSTPAMSEAMARLAPRGRAEVIPGERHMMALTVPDEVNRRLLAFLGTLDRSTSMTQQAPLDPKALRRALGSFLTGVTVVATIQENGEPRGFTANSFTSVSLDPPLVLVCIAKTASSYPVFSAAPHFSVNILAEHQAPVSSLFASKSADKFAKAAWQRGPAGSPILDEVTAWFDCRRHDVVEAGDHIILIGEVVGFDQRPANPLGYCRGAHITFGLQLDALAASGGRTRISAILEQDRAIVLVEDGRGGLELPSGAALGPAMESASLAATFQRLGLPADLGFLFAVYEDPARGAGAMSIVHRGTLRERFAPQPGVILAPFDAVPWERIPDAALATMLRRYIQERREDVFGIYVGDREQGQVQPLARHA